MTPAAQAQGEQQQQGQQPASGEELRRLMVAIEALGQQLEGAGGLCNEEVSGLADVAGGGAKCCCQS